MSVYYKRFIRPPKKYLMAFGAVCSCCGGRGWYDEGNGQEECTACAGTGFEV